MKFNTKDRVIFTLIMASLMVYTMVCYNIFLENGWNFQILAMTLPELLFMLPFAFILEFFVVDHLASTIAFKIIDPIKSNTFKIVITISTVIVFLMCIFMSFIATIIYSGNSTFLVNWFVKVVYNLPFALLMQLVIIGPAVRKLWELLTRKNGYLIKP